MIISSKFLYTLVFGYSIDISNGLRLLMLLAKFELLLSYYLITSDYLFISSLFEMLGAAAAGSLLCFYYAGKKGSDSKHCPVLQGEFSESSVMSWSYRVQKAEGPLTFEVKWLKSPGAAFVLLGILTLPLLVEITLRRILSMRSSR